MSRSTWKRRRPLHSRARMASGFLARRLVLVAQLSRHRFELYAHRTPTWIHTATVKPAKTELGLLARNMTSQTDSRAADGVAVTTSVQGEVGVGEGVESEGGGGGDGGEDVSGEGDKYQYLQRGFTSEIFKIEIQNIPKYIGYGVRIINSSHIRVL